MVCLWYIGVSDSSCWPLEGERQDNPSLISLGIMRFGRFWKNASPHCPLLRCLAHVLSSLEALSWILLTLFVACTSRRPIRIPPSPFFVSCWLNKWSCFPPSNTLRENSSPDWGGIVSAGQQHKILDVFYIKRDSFHVALIQTWWVRKVKTSCERISSGFVVRWSSWHSLSLKGSQQVLSIIISLHCCECVTESALVKSGTKPKQTCVSLRQRVETAVRPSRQESDSHTHSERLRWGRRKHEGVASERTALLYWVAHMSADCHSVYHFWVTD